jgi:hypothetical protein
MCAEKQILIVCNDQKILLYTTSYKGVKITEILALKPE